MQTVSTPIPLYTLTSNNLVAPAYNSASVTGVTAYNLQTSPIVALTTGVDGTVSITLVDGNVTYVANNATATATNSYNVDPGLGITGGQSLSFYSSSTPTATNKLGSVAVNWSGPTSTTGTGGTGTTTSDVITATSVAATIGSTVTVNLTAPVTLAGATQYQVFVGGAASSAIVALGVPTTVYPAQAAGTTVQVKFLNAAGTQVGTTQNVTLK